MGSGDELGKEVRREDVWRRKDRSGEKKGKRSLIERTRWRRGKERIVGVQREVGRKFSYVINLYNKTCTISRT